MDELYGVGEFLTKKRADKKNTVQNGRHEKWQRKVRNVVGKLKKVMHDVKRNSESSDRTEMTQSVESPARSERTSETQKLS